MVQEYGIYLRKSRVDLEAEAYGQGDTLQRHRARLLELADLQNLTVSEIYEEVVSGETITSRPQMQKLLHDVEANRFAGVLVMEIERLARGDTIDQGIVARAFQFSGTKIITPAKTYDPANEFDQEYFEFGLYMSRREYKTINRRQQAGRMASVNEGKWPFNKAPYGYLRVKLVKQKGWTLEPDEHSAVVQDIFRWYTVGVPNDDGTVRCLGVTRIVRRLNNLHIPSPSGRDWTNSTIQSMLRNPAYAGWVRWGNRAQVKQIQEGVIIRTRPRAKPTDEALKLSKGLHPALITQECFDLAQKLLHFNPDRPGPKQSVTMNPLAGLIRCDQCGRTMVRRPCGNSNKDTLLCPYTSCHTVGSDLALLEHLIVQSMKLFLSHFDQMPLEQDTISEIAERTSLSSARIELFKELEQISIQETKAFDLVEQSVYTPEIFAQRISELTQRREKVSGQLTNIQAALDLLNTRKQVKKEIVPAFRGVLDHYELAKTPTEKNDLLRSVLDHVDYHKTVGGRYRKSDLKIRIFPKLPY